MEYLTLERLDSLQLWEAGNDQHADCRHECRRASYLLLAGAYIADLNAPHVRICIPFSLVNICMHAFLPLLASNPESWVAYHEISSNPASGPTVSRKWIGTSDVQPCGEHKTVVGDVTVEISTGYVLSCNPAELASETEGARDSLSTLLRRRLRARRSMWDPINSYQGYVVRRCTTKLSNPYFVLRAIAAAKPPKL